ncbi:MAG: AAA family ATPase, partial [Methanosarcinales archaeon]
MSEELHRQAEAYKKQGLELIKQGKVHDGKEYLLKAAERFEKAAQFSEGLIKDLRIKSAKLCRETAQNIEVRVEEIPSPSTSISIESKVTKTPKTGEFEQYIRDNIMQKNKENLPSWKDIGGLEEVKNLIKKSVVIGIIENKPEAIEAWNAILFYGPSGTGKTLMAAAVAKNIDASFFNVKVSQMLSKYYGDSPKIMSALFEVARKEAPSVIFIDEFDSIALSRSGEIDEESRRGLSTLLAELDGLSSKASKEFVLVIVATNTPEAIDNAIMSRFGKKIEIP